MKSYKNISAIAALSMAIALTFTSCGAGEAETAETTAANSDAAVTEAAETTEAAEAAETTAAAEVTEAAETEAAAETDASEQETEAAGDVYYGTGYHFTLNSTWVVSEIAQEDVECTLQLADPQSELEAATLFAVQAIPNAENESLDDLGAPIAEAYELMENFTVLENGKCKAGKYDAYSIVVQMDAGEGIAVNMNQILIEENGFVFSVMITAEQSLYTDAMTKANILLDTFEIEG